MDKTEWIVCLLCGSKTRNKVQNIIIIFYQLYWDMIRRQIQEYICLIILVNAKE